MEQETFELLLNSKGEVQVPEVKFPIRNLRKVQRVNAW